jgi:hypothetical protein
MRLSVLFSGILILAAGILTYAAPYGTPRTFLDIERRSETSQQSHHHVTGSTSAPAAGSHTGSHTGSNTGSNGGSNPSTGPSDTGTGRVVTIITRNLHSSTQTGPAAPAFVQHWAVMVGDRYYELAADRNSPHGSSLLGAQITLNVGTAPLTATNPWAVSRSKGRTTYSDDVIHQKAQAVIDTMSHRGYNLRDNNCQDFANQLSACIVNVDVTPEEHKSRCCIVV